MKRADAFTLIELLVVIAIIAMLMAIMMPALNMVKEYSRAAVCKSNLRQYGLAERIYLEDHNSRFAPVWTWLLQGDQPPEVGCWWHDARIDRNGTLWPYLKDKDVHICPTFRITTKHTKCPNDDHDPSIPIVPQYTYSKNAYLHSDAPGAVETGQQVVQPSMVVSFSEENTWEIGDDGNGWTPTDLCSAALNDFVLYNRGDQNYHPYAPIGGGGDCFATYHCVSTSKRNKGYANAIFVDGHVERACSWDPPDNVFGLLWPNGR